MTIDNFHYPKDAAGKSADPSWFSFSHCVRTPLPWADELEKGALALFKSAGKRPVWICSSGGIDSETVCEVFLKLGLPFGVLTLEYAGGKNAHDIRYAKRWCEANKVHHKIYPLDIYDFAKHELGGYVKEGYVAGELFRYVQLKTLSIVEEMGGFAILGGGEQLYEVDATKSVLTSADPYLPMEIGYATPLEWCRRNHTSHEPFFYFSTPEIMLAWLQIPLIDFVLNNPDFFRHPGNKYALKNCAIRYHFPSQEGRNKYTGYEQVLDLVRNVKAALEDQFGATIRKVPLFVSELRRELEPEK